VLSLNEIFRLTGVERFGLVTPYLDEIQVPIIANYEAAGFDCVAERHLGDRGNYTFSEYSQALVARMCREVAAAKPDAITVFCTNLRGAPVVAALEQELGIPIYDTVATAVWAAMRQAGTRPSRIEGWGRLFQEVA
jgi:maleate isomerase